MAMKHCPVCGEAYSETYKNCPFCEEAAAMDQGRPVHRRSGKRTTPQKGPNILTPVLVIVILVLAMLLVYLFFGSAIKEKLGLGAGSSQSSQSAQSASVGSAGGAASSIDPGIIQEPDISTPEPDGSGGTGGNGGPDVDLEAIAKLPKTLTVNNPDFTLSAGETYTVKVTAGGTGSYTWISSDDGVVSVDENGKVTAIANGRVEITVTDGAGRGGCIVYVKGGTAAPAGLTPTDGSQDDGKTPKLNREDFTLPVGQTWQLTISGITTSVTWSSKDPGVATVSGNGTVTAVAKGMTTITASFDNTRLTCIVRVP